MSHTPTTESVRCAFIADGGWTAEDRAAMFDRWHQEELRQAKAQALEEAATHLDRPFTLWHGDNGVTVKEGLNDHTRGVKLTDWLRQRAQQLKDDQ